MLVDVQLPSSGVIKSERELNEGKRDGIIGGGGEASTSSSNSAKDHENQVDVPTKCIKYVQKLEALCKLAFIDFEGRSDGESVKVWGGDFFKCKIKSDLYFWAFLNRKSCNKSSQSS